MAEELGLKVVKLRRLNRIGDPVVTQTIKKNLEPLRQNTKKQFAQQVYYEKNRVYQSPLMREEKGPVHQRLGEKRLKLRRLFPLGTNTSSILPKRRPFQLHRPNNNESGFKLFNTPGQFRKNKLNRLFSAQTRLERIRLNNRINNSPIKLRRLNTQLPPATNLTVQVKNPNYVPGNNLVALSSQNGAQKFKMVLDPVIQEEIAEVQRLSGGTMDGLPPMTRITPEMTNLPITTRFSLL